MDTLEVNKVIAAVLVAGIAFFVTGTIADHLIVQPELTKSVLKIEGSPAASSQTAAAKPAGLPPLAPLLAKADVKEGYHYTHTVCIACHTFNKGGHAGVGPNLYGIVGDPHAHMKGFDYSNAIKSKKGPWTYAELNVWLHSPSTYAPGTRMTFSGIPKAQTRADVIAYLKSISPEAPPFPSPEAAKPAAQTQAAAAAKSGGLPPLAPLLAKADVKEGYKYTHTVCIACHTFKEGGHAGVGPNLYGIVGDPHAHMKGFDYSSAIKSKKGPWTYAELNVWLHSPNTYAPGTRMTFPGIRNAQTRADVIAYLKSISPHAPPFPKPEAAKAVAPAAAPAAAAAKSGGLPPLAPLLAKADVKKGDQYAHMVCIACHTFKQGGHAGVGPNLYGIVGDPHAHMKGFDYSNAIKSKKGPWTYAELNEWLHSPNTYAPGTHMTFPGIPNAQTRADVIAYLKSISPSAPPLPNP